MTSNEKLLRSFIRLGVLFMITAIAAGAFGAHALRGAFTPEQANAWQTAVLYQLIHGVGVLAVAQMGSWVSEKRLLLILSILLGSTVLFSFSLYFLCLFNWPKLGIITPIGGIGFLLGWGLLYVSLFHDKK